MKLVPFDALALAKKVAKASLKYKDAEVIICPGFTELAAISEIIKGSAVKLGAQDCFWEEAGAFTGEVSPKHLLDYGVQYVIVGHSERREHLGETDKMVHQKTRMLVSLGITPIVCIGETFEERQAGQKEAVLLREIDAALNGISLNKLTNLIIAYEPVWVIGSGQAVDPFEAEHTHQVIKHALYELFSEEAVEERVKIIYGGSVDPENVAGFIKQPNIKGVLIGGASLDATEFGAIIASSVK